MVRVKITENRDKMMVLFKLPLQKGSIFMGNAAGNRETSRLKKKVLKSKDTDSCVIEATRKARTIVYAADIEGARSELGPLNLDYAEADKAMLEQALKLRKRFG